MIDLSTLASLVAGRLEGDPTVRVLSVSTDSKHVAPGALFVALAGRKHDGHRFVAEAARNGAVAALVAEGARVEADGVARVWVPSPLEALQRLAGWHRAEHLRSVVAITGSNGKTVTKDALGALLRGPGAYASPGSYNSQLGVALALLAAPAGSQGVFEAGISAPGEMSALRGMLRPDHGVLTNVGFSHIASFRDQRHLADEKLSLFASMRGWLLLPGDALVREASEGLACERVWVEEAGPFVEERSGDEEGTRLRLRFDGGERHEVRIKARSPEILDDILLAAKAAVRLGAAAARVAERLDGYAPPPTRMEVWRSPGGVTLVNDAHSSDPLSVRAALRATATLGAGGRKIFVFGGMGELGKLAEHEHRAVGALAAEQGFRHLLLLDHEQAAATQAGYEAGAAGGRAERVGPPEELPRRLGALARPGDVVLLKAPRSAGIAEAAGELFGAIAPSRLLVDLRAVSENVARLRAACGSGVSVLAVVKALAYGSDLAAMGRGIGQLPVDFLGVTTADEGAQLRAAGVRLPILVTLVTADEAAKIPAHRLTPALASFSQIEPLAQAARDAGEVLDVHAKIDTGMGRLGVLPGEAVALAEAARRTGWLRVTGVMTHFSSADDPSMDDFTREQIARFDRVRAALDEAGFRGLLTHAAASAAALRFPEARYGMVRLGLALHGVFPELAMAGLLPLDLAVSLVSKIALVREVPRGWTLGYGATYRVERETLRLGVVPLGYHDGLPRSLSGRGWAIVEGKKAPFLGRISMDSVLLDLSDIPQAREGSDALFFGKLHGVELRPEEVAAAAGSIAHELLSRIGPRVQRIYVGA